MKNKTLSRFRIATMVGIMAFITTGVISCKKKEINPSIGESSMSMKINGENWKAIVTTLHTDAIGDDEENPEYYYVMVHGVQTIVTGGDQDDTESLGIYITIPASKYRNPKGTYPVLLTEISPNNAWALFTSTSSNRQGHNYYPANSTGSSGTVEITDFEIGQQTVFGQPMGKEGYTKLSGKFTIDMQAITGSDDVLKMTDGKFNMNSGIGLFDY